MPELDCIRGLAVLGVLFLHGFEWQYGGFHFGQAARAFLEVTQIGSLGVDLFFVLSGFLITGILLDSREKPHYYSRFYTRRALRILPIYYLLLLLLFVLHSSSGQFLILSLFYLANVTGLFGVSCDYGPLWSLAVEEHYYLLWPLVVKNVRQKRIVLACIGIMVCVPLLRWACFEINWGRGSLDWYTWFVADGLATGSLLAVLLRLWDSRVKAARLCGFLLICSMTMGLCGKPWGIATRERALGAALQQTTINLFFAGILLSALLLGTSRFSRLVNFPILKFFGYISYGLYLDHLLAFRIYDRIMKKSWPSALPTNGRFELVVMKFVIAGGAAVAAAYLSRKYFEQYFLDLKDRIRWSRMHPREIPLPMPATPDMTVAS
jgi:peptidoglycan/LPS O-acetylase OafA/YrhL